MRTEDGEYSDSTWSRDELLAAEEPDAEWYLRAGRLEDWACLVALAGYYSGWHDPARMLEMRQALAKRGLMLADGARPGEWYALTPEEMAEAEYGSMEVA